MGVSGLRLSVSGSGTGCEGVAHVDFGQWQAGRIVFGNGMVRVAVEK